MANDNLADKTVFITGAGSGIGEAAALLFAKRGARIVVLDIEGNRAEAVAEEIRKQGGECTAIAADVGNESDMKQAIGETVSRFGSLDVLINNAASQIMGPLHECTEEQFDRMMQVNVKGVFFGCKYALPVMMSRRSGVVLSVSSVLGVVGDPDLSVYGATKGAIIALTKSLAVAYGPYGIRANCLCPGDVNTPMVKRFFDYQSDPEQARDQVNRHYPLRRIAEPEEIASALAFLASSDASFISGSSMFVDGGLTSEVY
ncbi:SDR family NAD(P)-dependent oxidoreductase [Paenibacillus contaminans]|uniref:Short-chain dehydrogenase n=1 Tax=Paenibacillus contaminans TaxID=450362 RepID=A0A329MG55_9BACL|nr:SDR family oxidoreductase [Paenibacillus contaminans]RAV18800.1 short-chain dehydrogenase [Paenibacillus contaminans]